MSADPRPDKFLEELPKHKWKVEPAAIAAGYSPSYARHCQKLILQRALKRQAEKALALARPDNANTNTEEIKKSLAELIGTDRESVFKRLRQIAFDQDKDLSSALKVLAPLAKDLGVPIGADDAPKTIVPILNIGVKQKDLIETTPSIIENGSVEP